MQITILPDGDPTAQILVPGQEELDLARLIRLQSEGFHCLVFSSVEGNRNFQAFARMVGNLCPYPDLVIPRWGSAYALYGEVSITGSCNWEKPGFNPMAAQLCSGELPLAGLEVGNDQELASGGSRGE